MRQAMSMKIRVHKLLLVKSVLDIQVLIDLELSDSRAGEATQEGDFLTS